MKYEHTLVLDVSFTIVNDSSDDLSGKYADAVKKLLCLFPSKSNFVRSLDFIQKKNEEEDQGDWIRFDPYDRRTWPNDDPCEDFDTVLVCSEDDYIYIGYISLVRKDPTTKFEWILSNTSEDIQVPLDVVKAWQPLPKTFHM